LGVSHVLFSQSKEDELFMTSSQKNKSLFLKSQEETSFKAKNVDNQVAIIQIGSFNDATIIKNAEVSSITNVIQDGRNNFIYSYKDAKTINMFVEQNGSNNVIIDFGKNKNSDTNQRFFQKGSNLNILSTGLNSISKDMTIQQIGSSRTVSVISLN